MLKECSTYMSLAGILLFLLSPLAIAEEDIAGIYPATTFQNESSQTLQQDVFIFSAVDDRYYAIIECETQNDNKTKTLILPVSMNEKTALFSLQDKSLSENSCPNGTYTADFMRLFASNDWRWQENDHGDLVRISRSALNNYTAIN